MLSSVCSQCSGTVMVYQIYLHVNYCNTHFLYHVTIIKSKFLRPYTTLAILLMPFGIPAPKTFFDYISFQSFEFEHLLQVIPETLRMQSIIVLRLRLWCLASLSTILQLYRGSQCYCLRKQDCPEKTCRKSLTNFTT